MPKKLRKLEELDIDEVSLVDLPANMKKFYFVKNDDGSVAPVVLKADTQFRIESDGTSEGTTLYVNGKAVENLDGVMFDFYGGAEKTYLQYTTAEEENEDGMREKTTYMSKAQKPSDELVKAFENSTGQKLPDELVLMDEEQEEVQKSLSMLQEYAEDFPPDVKESVEVIVDKALAHMIAKAEWSTAYINDLPDKAFAHIESGGEKDEDGKTTPRKLRHLPYKDKKGDIDKAHLKNALARLPQTDISKAAKEKANKELVAAAKKVGLPEYTETKKESSMSDEDTAKEDQKMEKLVENLSKAITEGNKNAFDEAVKPLTEGIDELKKMFEDSPEGEEKEKDVNKSKGEEDEDITEEEISKMILEILGHQGIVPKTEDNEE